MGHQEMMTFRGDHQEIMTIFRGDHQEAIGTTSEGRQEMIGTVSEDHHEEKTPEMISVEDLIEVKLEEMDLQDDLLESQRMKTPEMMVEIGEVGLDKKGEIQNLLKITKVNQNNKKKLRLR